MDINNEKLRNVAEVAAKIMGEALKGNQHKIDANKNGKIDAQDFKILRGEKKMKEEVELDEGRMKDIYTTMQQHATKKGYSSHKQFTSADYHEMGKEHGISGPDLAVIAGHKTAHQALKKEEVEQIDEVAAEDHSAQQVYDKAHMAYMNKHHKNVPADKQKAAESEAHKHASAIMKAKYPHHTASKGEGQVYRLSKEEIELLDELNKSTLSSYVNASARDAVHRTAKEVETGRLDKLADKRMKGIKLATKKLAKEETVSEGTYKQEVEKSFPASGVKTGASAPKGTSTMPKDKEKAKGQSAGLPFTPDKEKTKVATAGKFGYGYSAARHLARQGMAKVTKEEAEQVEEAITKTSTGYIHHARPGVYGGSEKEKHVVDTLTGPKKSELEKIEKEKKMKKFSEMLDLINTRGLKALSEMINEEPDNETFTKELKDQQDKSEGKKKQPELSKGDVVAVKQEEVEQLDELSPKILGSYVKKAHRSGTDNSFDHGEDEHRQYGDPDEDPEREKEMQDRERAIANREKGIHRAVKRLTKEEQVEERSLTEPEMKKKEEIVKSMKKGLAGFKARYGDRAKEVMYATATKQAKGE